MNKPISQIAALSHQLDMAAAMIVQQKQQIKALSETIQTLHKSRPPVTMTGDSLGKLTAQERNHLIDQVGAIEIVG